MSHIMRKCVFGHFRPGKFQTSLQKLARTLDRASIHIKLSKQRTTKVLIRLRGCAGWSAPLLFAYGIRHVFAWPGPYYLLLFVAITYTWAPSKWHVRHRKTLISLGISTVWSVFTISMKNRWVLGFPQSAQWRYWSDWAHTLADVSLRWAHMSFCWFCNALTQICFIYLTFSLFIFCRRLGG